MAETPANRAETRGILKSPLDFAGGLFLIALAVAGYAGGFSLPFGQLSGIGSGLMPKTVALLVGAFGVLLLVQSLFINGDRLEAWAVRGPIFVLGGVLVFAATARPWGLVVAGPLSAIVTNSNACLRWLAGNSPNLDEAREAARRIIRDGNRASEVINRIRALVRKTDTEKVGLNINDAIGEIVALADGEVRRNSVALRTELADDLPLVVGDRVQLQQVILNLVMNGVEAMASVADRPRELFIRSRQHESDKVLIAVQDSGIGIDQQNLEKLFDAFYTTKSQGMGMGLAISRSIVENHGGRLWATANESRGAVFQFTLPTGGGEGVMTEADATVAPNHETIPG